MLNLPAPYVYGSSVALSPTMDELEFRSATYFKLTEVRGEGVLRGIVH